MAKAIRFVRRRILGCPSIAEARVQGLNGALVVFSRGSLLEAQAQIYFSGGEFGTRRKDGREKKRRQLILSSKKTGGPSCFFHVHFGISSCFPFKLITGNAHVQGAIVWGLVVFSFNADGVWSNMGPGRCRKVQAEPFDQLVVGGRVPLLK